jgi:heme/copper-type cytochrome/quinol oxidase subunit 2
MTTVLAMSKAAETTIAIIAVWVVAFPAFVTGLIVYAVVQARGERRADEQARHRRQPY